MAAARLGLRLRVALALTLACLVVVGALGFTLYTASEELEDALIDQILAEEMDDLVRRHHEDAAYRPQGGSNLQSFIRPGPAADPQLPPFLAALAPGRHEVRVGRDEYHVLVREVGTSRYYVAYDVGLHEEREAKFRRLLLLSLLGAAAAAGALGYLFSGPLVRQVTDLAARVAALGTRAPRARLVHPAQDPEVAMLARAFEDHQDRIEQMIRREREFTSNASHELRTPLTAIRTSCEMLLADPGLADRSRARVEWIAAAAARMSEQLETLLCLARGEVPGVLERVPIAECAREAVDPCRAEIARKGLALELDIARDAALELDRRALQLVLSNLVRNAVRYTERGFVRIRYADRHLTVADSGRGIEPARLAHVFERFFREGPAGEGTGIGLAIVKRICEHYGWRIAVESAPGKGSSFTITFP